MKDYKELKNCFVNIRFRIAFDSARFVADYKNSLEDFFMVVTVFPDEYKASIFLQKIPGTTEPCSMIVLPSNNSCMFSYFYDLQRKFSWYNLEF